jgi:predicted O-methyltransferase YrrM
MTTIDLSSLTGYLNSKNAILMEGYSQQVQPQLNDLISLTTSAKSILEIGFNGGHSSEFFLSMNTTVNVTSFDLGEWDYVKVGKEYIDVTFPGRHLLILGDSTKTIPKYCIINPEKKFDFIFIDGGHSYDVAMADLKNCLKFAHTDTIVAVDDTMYNKEWTFEFNVGPTKAWIDAVDSGLVTEIKRSDYWQGRGMSWGKYTL